MQLSREDGNVSNAITAYAAGEIRMRDRVFRASLIATREAVIEDWKPAIIEQLGIGDFVRLLELAPDVVILGTGPKQRMPPPELFAAFAARRIGLEVMDTGAACRTYNLLLSEFR
ncbi:MAG: Mth938-like domain-containing protein, partial [Steroidobacteraceae bacterium]